MHENVSAPRSAPQPMVADTNIPADPRQRTKHHARLEVTFWFDCPDEVLKDNPESSCAADLLREKESEIQDLMNRVGAELFQDVKHVSLRVGQ